MRTLFLTLALLVSALSSAQTSTTTESEEPSIWVNDVLVPYVQTYVSAMNGDGWDLSSIRDTDVFIIFDYDLGQEGIDRMVGKAGLALGMNNDELVYVIISAEAWLTLEEFERQDLINHELMHDIFNVQHTGTGQNKLMDTKSFPKSWADTFFRLIDAIKDLNESYESK